MTTNSGPVPRRPDDVRWPPSAIELISGTVAHIKPGHTIIMLCSLLVAASVLLTTISCTPIPCPSGYEDPNWCQRRGGGGGGGESGN
jgi:hypothetical protein